MKAVVRTTYGSPEVVGIREVAIPTPKDNEVLIRVYATTVNRTDCAILSGKPFIMRFFTGLLKPTSPIAGTDFAGQIEAVGKEVNSFKKGDKVWGFDDTGLASHAQFMTLSANKAIQLIPANITYQQAAASAEGAHYAYNFINKVVLKTGQKVLVNGATGAIGSAVVQFLKYFHLSVTAVCHANNIDQVKLLGADRVIDYATEDFTTDTETYDYIFDAVGKSTFAKCKSLLKSNGIYISSELGPYSQNLLLALTTPLLGGKKVIFPVPIDIKSSMHFISKLLEEGAFKPLIDRTYTMEQIQEAYTYAGSGKKTGNVVITYD